MAAVMPGTVIRFGAEYRRRPVLSLFGPKERGDGTITILGTHIRVQASIAITREFPDSEDAFLLTDETEEPEDPRGKIVDIIT